MPISTPNNQHPTPNIQREIYESPPYGSDGLSRTTFLFAVLIEAEYSRSLSSRSYFLGSFAISLPLFPWTLVVGRWLLGVHFPFNAHPFKVARNHEEFYKTLIDNGLRKRRTFNWPNAKRTTPNVSRTGLPTWMFLDIGSSLLAVGHSVSPENVHVSSTFTGRPETAPGARQTRNLSGHSLPLTPTYCGCVGCDPMICHFNSTGAWFKQTCPSGESYRCARQLWQVSGGVYLAPETY